MNRVDGRRPRCGAPRDPAPGRRPAGPARFELWTLRALWPDATAADLADLDRRRARILAREREALAGLWSGDKGILAPGHSFLASHPDLREGLLVTVHLGPYALVPELLVAAGRSPLVLVTARARQRNEERTARLLARLGFRSGVTWLDVERRRSLVAALRGLREGCPVVAYLDGNIGRDGYEGTRERGLEYRLPGRSIHVRTGLARLAARAGTPLHLVAAHWDADGQPVWERGPSCRPQRGDDPAVATRRLCDWCFARVLAYPEQWSFRGMLQAAAACFGRAALTEPPLTAGLRADYTRAFRSCLARAPRTVRLRLEHEVEVWSGRVLADLTSDRFYPAAGLADADLAPLRRGEPTLAELVEHHGRAWVAFHGLRLCLLGVARLGA